MSQTSTAQWCKILTEIRPYGATDLVEVLTMLNTMVNSDAAWIVVDGGVEASVGVDAEAPHDGLVDIATGATSQFEEVTIARADMKQCNGVLVVARETAFDTSERETVSAIGPVLAMALHARNRRAINPEVLTRPAGVVPAVPQHAEAGVLARESFRSFLLGEFGSSDVPSLHRSKKFSSEGLLFLISLSGLGDAAATGHETGGLLERASATRIRACVRDVDIIGQLGDGLFAVYCDALPIEFCEAIPKRVQFEIQRAVSTDGATASVRAAIGACVYTGQQNGEELLAQAEIALREAQKTPEGLVVFDGGLKKQSERTQQLAAEFHTALVENELSTLLEPIVAMPGGQLLAYEATVRWEHPVHGWISHGEFMVLAELMGRSTDVDKALLLFALNSLIESEEDDKTTIKLSAATLTNPNHVYWMLEQIRHSTVSGLVIEVDEDTIANGGDQVVAHLQAFYDIGVAVILHGFASRTGSLVTLHKFPFDGVKFRYNANLFPKQNLSILNALHNVADTSGFDVIHTGLDSQSAVVNIAKFHESLKKPVFFCQGLAVVNPASQAAAA